MKNWIKTIATGVKNIIMSPKRSRILLEASVMWTKAKEEAEEMRKRDGHRYFVVYDVSQDKLIPITYDLYRNRGDSYKYLRLRGRFKTPLRREQLKELCFYYTGSKWGSRPCEGNEEQEKMKEWQGYYLRVKLSTKKSKHHPSGKQDE